MKYSFSDYELNDDLLELRLEGRVIPMEPQVFALLRYLIKNCDHVVSKDELIDHVWNGRIVSDATVTSRINLARHAVGDSGKHQHSIKTYPKRGFRFVADVTTESGSQASAMPGIVAPSGEDETRSRLRSVMVAPLENQTGLPGFDHIATGLAEELSITLGRLKWLRVVPFGSVLSLQGDGATRLEIAHELNARYVLEGNIRASGDQIQITCRLTNCDSDQHLWGDHFESRAEMSFELQNSLARNISAELGRELAHAEVVKTDRSSPASFEAWDYYLRALVKIHLVEQAANASARQDLKAAIRLDPEFAPAHSQLAWCHSMAAIHRWSRPGRAALSKATHHAERAVSIDPYDPLAFCAMSIAHFWQGDQIKALTAARQAAELDRGSLVAQGLTGCAQAISGSPDAALKVLSATLKGSRKDPFRWFWMQGCANACFALERYDEASDWAREVIEMRPNFVYGHVIHIAGSTLGSRPVEARHSISSLLEIVPDYCVARFKSHPMWSDQSSIDHLATGLTLAGLPEVV